MSSKQISLASLLLFAGAAPIWILLTVIVARSPGFGFVHSPSRWFFAPLILLIATGAIFYLLHKRRNGLALAAFLAALALTGSIVAAAYFSTLLATVLFAG